MSRWRRQQRRRARRAWSTARLAAFVREFERQMALEPHPFVPAPGSVAPSAGEIKKRLNQVIVEARAAVDAGLLPAWAMPPRDQNPIAIYDEKKRMLRVYFTDGVKN